MKMVALPYGEEIANMFVGLCKVEEFHSKSQINKNTVVVFGGGTDVNPKLYGEKRHPMTSYPDYKRDLFETTIFNHTLEVGANMLGICRGSQFLTVANGGKLVQHIGTAHCGNHPIVYRNPIDGEEGTVEVTSTHHQMMWPFEGVGRYDILGWTMHGYEANYHCMNPDIVAPPPEKEPEIVWYPETRSLAIQGHPEYLGASHPFHILTKQFVNHFFQEQE